MAWAFAQRAPDARVGYVQTAGGALPGRPVGHGARAASRGLLAGHITAGPAFGGEEEAITTAGAIHHGARRPGLGRRPRRPGPGDPRLRLRARPRRHGRARHRPRRAGARLPDGARPADVSGTRARATTASRHHTRTVLELLLAPVRRGPPGAGVAGWRDRRGLDAAARVARRRSRRSTSTATSRAACRRGRWAATSTRTSCSSPPRSRAARRWRNVDGGDCMSFEHVGGETICEGRIVDGARRALPLPRRRGGRARDRRHPGAVGIVATTTSTSGSSASRARRRRDCSRSPPASSTRRARTRCDTAKRELAEEIGKGADSGST